MSRHRFDMVAVGEPVVRVALEEEPIGSDEVEIAVAGCGVCHTDLGFLFDGVRPRHELPLALGHEISGRVVRAGSGAEDLVGQAVIVPAVMPCGTCDLCRDGWGTICPRQKMPGNDIQGGFATHVVVPAAGLCRVPEEDLARLPENGLATLSVIADAVSTPYQAVKRSGLAEGDVAVVVGLGGVGGFAAQISAAFGATVIGLDVDPRKLEIMREYGVSLALDPRETDAKALRKRLREFAKEQRLPTVRWRIFECSGTAAGQQTAYGLLNHGAWLSVVGYTMDTVTIRLSNLMAFDATAAGNWGCVPEHYPDVLRLVLDGRVQVEPFVELRPLEDVNQVLEEVHAHSLEKRAILVP